MAFTAPTHFLTIDEEGFPLQNEKRITDFLVGQELLRGLRFAKNGALISSLNEEDCIIEAFDQPIVAQSIEADENGDLMIFARYETPFPIDIRSLRVDEWDRFHGMTTNAIPFVLSKKAQADFFEMLEEFDDDSITWNGNRIETPEYFSEFNDVDSAKYWTHIYQTEVQPGWDLKAPATALVDMLPRLKLPRSRILVPGCGEGHDAALIAKEGHVVTAVDFSSEAIDRAKKNYGHIAGLSFLQADIFQFAKTNAQRFDYIFEHTCFCAINPSRRQELVKAWNSMLTTDGQIIAILFTMEKRFGPPFGGTEWEYRKRLEKYFHFLFWGRWRQSVVGRQGKELFILAKKRRSE